MDDGEGLQNRVLVATSDRKLWDTIDHNNGCETRYSISQV